MQNQQNDIRWEQRFSNYCKALSKLEEGVESIMKDREETISELEREGMIQRFEYTHELAWNVMKDYAAYQGDTTIGGSRDATRAAFKLQLFTDAEGWMQMIKDRNETSHSYNEDTAIAIFERIVHQHFALFTQFKQVMEAKRSGTQGDLFSKA